MKPKVYVTFPLNPAHPYLHKRVVMVSWQLLRDSRFEAHLSIPTHNPYENNLHHCVQGFLKNDCEYWLSIDADNPPLWNPMDLVYLDLDIIGLPTPVWHFDGATKQRGERPLYYNAWDYVEEKDAYKEHDPKVGLQRIDAAGTGCFLISKRVFLDPEMQKAPFQRELYPNGCVRKGNDIKFCERARARGWKIYTHYDYLCMHFNEIELNEMVYAFRNLYEGGEVNG